MTKPNAVSMGDYLYLFESKVGGDKCIISAHGAYLRDRDTFSLSALGSDIRLFFYGEHNKVLLDPGLDVLSTNQEVVNEYPRDGDAVNNYLLSKFAGRHSGGSETYEKIEEKLAYHAEQMQQYEDNMDYVLAYPEIRKIYESLASCHVVTVRNRWNKPAVSLKYVIETVRSHRPDIRNFHCLFCRSWVGDAILHFLTCSRWPED